LTELNNYGIEAVIPESKTLKEVLCPAKQDSMPQEPFTTSSCGGLKSDGSWMTTMTEKTLSAAWVILPKRLKPRSTLGP
jgi:hypothetical protein